MNYFKRIFFSVFPRPQTRLAWLDALPLVVFLALFAATCVALEWTNAILFARPMAFLLTVLTVWIWWMHVAGFSGLGRFRGQLALQTRLVLAGLFILLMAQPRAVRTQDTLTVIYAVDISDSIEGSVDRALEFVARTVADKPQEDEAGVIVFGRNAAVELPPRMNVPVEGDSVVFNSIIDRDATNLEKSLSLAAAMLPDEKRGRIVLISDGTQTEGSLQSILSELKSREIAVDVLPVRYEYEDEIWLERLELPRAVKLGENYQVAVVLSSLKAGEGTLTLTENGQERYQEKVQFQAGKNRFVVPIYLNEAGYYEYTATIAVDGKKDNQKNNNKVTDYIFVEGEGRVLLVTDPNGEEADWKSLEKALIESERSVEVRSALEMSRDTLSMMSYDCIVFVNVGVDEFDVVQMQAVHDAVKNLGLGFMMVGGENSFGPGGYHRTLIEDILPVSMDVTKKKVLPKGALAIILHTCEFPEGNTWGKRITKQAIKVLHPQDEIGVLVYDYMGGEKWLFDLTPARDYDKLVPLINKAEIGDMPSFVTTMQMGLASLKKSDASAKHMIIISDGDPSRAPPALIKQFIDNKISVSTIAVFPHGGNEISNMRAVAGATKGRYYFPSDPNRLPAIFIKEANTLKRTMIQDKTILPEIDFPHSVLKGIEEMQPLHGYVLTSAKEAPNRVILRAPPDKENPGEIDPVLAMGRYGLGATAAFTSDLSSNWGKDWVEWDKYRSFVKQLVTSISRVRKQGNVRIWTYTNGNEGTIIAEDFHPEERFLEIEAAVSGPRDRSETIKLRQVGPRRYQASLPLWGRGHYQVMTAASDGSDKETNIVGIIVPYSPEYLRFRADPIVLREIADATGGQELAGDDKSEVIYQANREPKSSSSPVHIWFLVALACLIPLDVGIRRIQLDWHVIRGWLGLGRKAGPSTAVMGALLERKQAVSSDLEARSGESVRPTSRPRTKPAARRSQSPKRTSPKPTSTTDRGNEADSGGDGGSTTSRLLEMKRRRQEDKEEED
ncbi:MAG: VWA domain-containing protein [Planctomycetaceae bacterium]|jgi:Ca-activated chloride channel homolog|nr:VWA domain-containing protein [Planctomycetaceae bacterium]MBT6154449.1 VWA domain-containing protein [Planctomycetaceae bacterium]MBT6487260.1 VWA domain-containing protein [Planctomycetaceae bacterium]MBT6498260.1 VWA domain-containing protein [Planctomycetaceae bacterium]